MTDNKCKLAPPGWRCIRKAGHLNPCAAEPVAQRLCFVQDDDGHWYMIPASKREAFETWVESNDPDYDGYYQGEDFDRYILGGGIANYTFENVEEI